MGAYFKLSDETIVEPSMWVKFKDQYQWPLHTYYRTIGQVLSIDEKTCQIRVKIEHPQKAKIVIEYVFPRSLVAATPEEIMLIALGGRFAGGTNG